VTRWRLSASVAVVQGGAAVALRGDDRVTTFRSAAKPFQLAVSLEALGDPSLDDEDLAVGAASHSAEPVHVARVEALLRRFGLDASGLRCGAHAPSHTPSAEAVIRAGGAYTALHNNCSGKHTFMLAACAHQGWDPEYLPPEHPYQQRVFAAVSDWMAHVPYTVTDGCGVPTFVQPLSAAARGWWQVARAMATEPTGRLGRIGHAMAKHPALTSGTGRLDLDVVRAAREPMAVKVGAGGLFCVALPARDLGIAVKVHGGVMEALPALIAWALETYAPEAWRAPDDWELLKVRSVAGREVGGWITRAR
jgi:L-asparaginase II